MTIFIAIVSILVLVALHELGHFLFAKLFKVKVEEFGIGLPPRVVGKKVGETIYSINLLPLGAFVRMEGEEKRLESTTSFSSQALWKRAIIVAAGVVAFWIVAILIFSVLGATSGIPMGIDDSTQTGVANPHVQIIEVESNSPAAQAKLLPGDIIEQVRGNAPTTVKEVQDITKLNAGEVVSFLIQRGAKTFGLNLIPRANPLPGQGAIGVVLTRTAFVQFPWYKAPIEGVKVTWQLTVRIAEGLGGLVMSLVQKHNLPQGVQLSGPIGIVGMLSTEVGLGAASFFAFVGMLSVYLAIFNVLPIPASDGGRLVLLLVEFLRKKPLPEKLEQRIIGISFVAIFLLFIYVTFQDIVRLF